MLFMKPTGGNQTTHNRSTNKKNGDAYLSSCNKWRDKAERRKGDTGF